MKVMSWFNRMWLAIVWLEVAVCKGCVVVELGLSLMGYDGAGPVGTCFGIDCRMLHGKMWWGKV